MLKKSKMPKFDHDNVFAICEYLRNTPKKQICFDLSLAFVLYITLMVTIKKLTGY